MSAHLAPKNPVPRPPARLVTRPPRPSRASVAAASPEARALAAREQEILIAQHLASKGVTVCAPSRAGGSHLSMMLGTDI